MKTAVLKISVLLFASLLICQSCGRDGEPGQCLLRVSREYYYPGFGVNTYTDNNPDIPGGDALDWGAFYLSEPGVYDFSYSSEDADFFYDYNGYYELNRDEGSRGRLFKAGVDGMDTFLTLYLKIYDDPGMKEVLTKSMRTGEVGKSTIVFENRVYEVTSGEFTLKMHYNLSVRKK